MAEIFNKYNKHLLAVITFIAAAIAFLPVIKNSFPLGLNLNSFSLLLIPFILYIKEPGMPSYRFGIITLILLILYMLAGFPVLLFIAGTFLLLFIIETFYGKLNFLAYSVVILLAPLTLYMFNIAGFYVRIMLTDIAANILKITGHNCISQGNLILLDNHPYTVEAECMGLNMVRTGLLFCLFFISLHEKKYKRDMSRMGVLVCMTLAMLTILVANLLRIIMVVKFRILPESPMHEIAGLICLTAGIIFPLNFITGRLFRILSRSGNIATERKSDHLPFAAYALICAGICGIFTFSYLKPFEREGVPASVIEEVFAGYRKSQEKFAVLRFQSDAAIVYVKAPVQFYRTDHHPLICWQASGFDIKKEATVRKGKFTVGYAEMVKGNEILYSYWWYDNGVNKSMSEFNWRFDNMTGGKKYSLVNIASKHKFLLEDEVIKLLNRQILR
jgi:exosortase N